MQEVIRVNSVKRAPATSEEQVVVPGVSNLELGLEVDRYVVDDSKARFKELVNLEEDGKSGESMEAIRGMEEDRPLQFHHVTQRQFESRKERIKGILSCSSEHEAAL